jgi:hypothetical protein
MRRFDTEVGGGFLLGALFMVIVIAFAGCATTAGTFCDLARPVRLSEAAVAAMTDAEVKEALRQNRIGQEQCGWAP